MAGPAGFLRELEDRLLPGIAAGQAMGPGRRSSTGCAPDVTWARARTGLVGHRRDGGARPPARRGCPPRSAPATSRNRCSPRCWTARLSMAAPARRPPPARGLAHGGQGGMARICPAIRPVRRPSVLIGRPRAFPWRIDTKIHLLADARCRPMARVVTAGQRHDSDRVTTPDAAGWIRRLRAGTAADPPGPAAGRQGLLEPGDPLSPAATPHHRDHPGEADQRKTRAAKGSAGGRPPGFDPEIYKQRNTVERAINKLKAFRGVRPAHRQTRLHLLGTIDVASIKIWLRDPVRQDPIDTP